MGTVYAKEIGMSMLEKPLILGRPILTKTT